MSKNRTDYFLLLIFIIHLVALGSAVDGFMSHKVKLDSFASCILPLTLVCIIVKYKPCFKNLKNLIIAFALLIVVQVLLIVKYDSHNIIIGKYYDVFVAFLFARTLGLKTFFRYFEKAVVLLTVLSLPLWFIAVLFPMTVEILRPFSLPVMQDTTGFTLGIIGLPNMPDEGIIRNTGFAWEPGRFAAMISLALLVNQFQNKFKFNNRNFIILLIGLLSTQSTTGLIAFSICLVGIYVNFGYNFKHKWVKYVIIAGFAAFFILSPFMLTKIGEVADMDHWMNDNAALRKETYSPQRLEGIYLEALNIEDSPWIGYGEKLEYSYVRRVVFPTLDIFLPNGLLKTIAEIGIPLALLFYICLWRSSKLISIAYQAKGKGLIFGELCLINISYNFFQEPLVIFIALYSIFYIKTEDRFNYAKDFNNNPNIQL